MHAVTREELTYEQLLENTCVLADTLRNYGCQKGTVISICSENSLLFYQPIIAAFYIGCVVAPINPAYGKGKILNVHISFVIFSLRQSLFSLIHVCN